MLIADLGDVQADPEVVRKLRALTQQNEIHAKFHLVGGLVAIFYFPIYWVANHPN